MSGSPARPGSRAILLGLLLVAAGLRVWGALHHPFVQDELYTLIDARWLLDSPLETGVAARPLYYLLQHVLLPLTPETEIGLRVLPLVFGVAGVWATWALTREAFDRRAAVLAALMATIAPWHLYISEMARYWSLVYLLVCLFLLAYMRLAARKDARHWGWLGLGCLVLGSLTHPTFLFPVVGIFLLDGARIWRTRTTGDWWSDPIVRRIWLPYAAFAAVVLGILLITGEASTVQERSSRGLEAFLRLLPAVVQWITPALSVGAAVAVVGFLFSDRESWRRWGRLAVAAGSSTIVLLMVSASVSEVYTDYAVGVVPLAFVSLGGIVTMIDPSTTRGRLVGASLVGLMVFAVLPSTVSHVSDGTRFDFRPAFEFVRQTDPELPVYTSPIALQHRYADDLEGRRLATADPSDLEAALEKSAVWVVAPLRRYGLIHDSGGEVRRWLARRCSERLSYERPRFDYRMYRVKVYRCGPDGDL